MPQYESMYARFRKWKHAGGLVFGSVGVCLLEVAREGTLLWYAVMILIAASGSAYIIEEIAWNIRARAAPAPSVDIVSA